MVTKMEDHETVLHGDTVGNIYDSVWTRGCLLDVGRADLAIVDVHVPGLRLLTRTKRKGTLGRLPRWWYSQKARSSNADVWLFRISDTANPTLVSQLDKIKQTLLTSEDVVITYQKCTCQSEKQSISRLLCLQHFEAQNESSESHHEFEANKLQRSMFEKRRHLLFLAVTTMVLLLAIITTVLGLASLTPKPKQMGRSAIHTTGLANQLYLTGSNVSEWRAQNNASQWRLRLDDQSMIPLSMLDERELKVQAWFEETFPALKLNRDSGRYLDADYLALWDEIILDEKYHIAHCVAAFRRYLVAMETGRHICRKDVSLAHLQHCVQQLENFAFRSNSSWVSQRERTITLKWHTDICF